MFFKYGNYKHEVGMINLLDHQRMAKRTAVGGRLSWHHVMHFVAEIRGDTTGKLVQNCAKLESAYSEDMHDAGLYYDNGSPTVHVLRNKNAINGVQVAAVRYLEDNGAEHNFKRTIDIVLEADILDPISRLLAYEESFTMIGGVGYTIAPVMLDNGGWTLQRFNMPVVKEAIQIGHKETIAALPMPNPPLFPGLELWNLRQITRYSPGIGLQHRIGMGVRWEYHFVAMSTADGYVPTQYNSYWTGPNPSMGGYLPVYGGTP